MYGRLAALPASRGCLDLAQIAELEAAGVIDLTQEGAREQTAALRDYLLAVGLAVRGGMDREQAMRAVGADAALILGVADRVGTLEPGKDADFVILSGDPLAIGTMVESTWVDGHRAYQRTSDSSMLAIRCGKILDGQGRVYRDGVLIYPTINDGSHTDNIDLRGGGSYIYQVCEAGGTSTCSVDVTVTF